MPALPWGLARFYQTKPVVARRCLVQRLLGSVTWWILGRWHARHRLHMRGL